MDSTHVKAWVPGRIALEMESLVLFDASLHSNQLVAIYVRLMYYRNTDKRHRCNKFSICRLFIEHVILPQIHQYCAPSFGMCFLHVVVVLQIESSVIYSDVILSVSRKYLPLRA
jgi:hypothetical protein